MPDGRYGIDKAARRRTPPSKGIAVNLMTSIGAGLVALALIIVLVGSFGYTETTRVLQAGPIQVDTQEEHRIAIPTAVGVVVFIAGVGLIIAGRRA